MLKKKGFFCFTVTHPGWDLYEYSRKHFTGNSEIMPKIGPYFTRQYLAFMMNQSSIRTKVKKQFQVAHFQRPLEDYINGLIQTGFHLQKIAEPQIPLSLINDFPEFKELKDYPISIVFLAQRL